MFYTRLTRHVLAYISHCDLLLKMLNHMCCSHPGRRAGSDCETALVVTDSSLAVVILNFETGCDQDLQNRLNFFSQYDPVLYCWIHFT